MPPLDVAMTIQPWRSTRTRHRKPRTSTGLDRADGDGCQPRQPPAGLRRHVLILRDQHRSYLSRLKLDGNSFRSRASTGYVSMVSRSSGVLNQPR